MVTLNEQQQGGSRNNSTGRYKGHKGNRDQKSDIRKYKTNSDGNPVTECGFCELIRGKDVSQEYLKLGFNERHRNISHLTIWANNCLPWLKLSIDDREKVLRHNELYCKECLRPLRLSTTGNSCSKRIHTRNTGFNGMCVVRECDRHSTMCRRHKDENKAHHKLLKASLDWAQDVRSQQ